MFYFFSITPLMVLLTLIGAVLSSVIMNFMHTRKLYPYTFPFILSTWILMAVIYVFDLVPWQASSAAQQIGLNIYSSLSMGFGQVMFQASIVTGIIFLIAILINSRIAALYAFFGSLIGMLAGIVFSLSLTSINLGIFGYNGVLCGIAFADRKKISFIYALISIILSIIIIYGMMQVNIIALTSPFVFAAWITLVIKHIAEKK